MGFFSSCYRSIKSAASSVWTGITLHLAFELSPYINAWKWLVTKTKRLVNSFSEWKDNAMTLLKKRYSNWLSGLIFTAGLLLFTIPTVVTFLLDTLFVNSDNGASDEQLAKNIAQALSEQAKKAEERGDFEDALKLYEQALNSSQDEDDKEINRRARDNVVDTMNNIEAEKMNDEGWAAFNRGEFEMAKDKFVEALGKCTSDYENRQKFSNNWNKVMGKILNGEGRELFNYGSHSEAIEKFRDAQRYQYDDENCNYIAECYYELGIKFYNQKNLEKAKEFYQKAVNECTRDYSNEEKFKASLRAVFNDIKNQEAEEFYSAGQSAFNERHFERAQAEFLQAYNHCTPDYKNKRFFKESADTAAASTHNRRAIEHHSEGKYHEAIEEHIKALKTIPRERLQELKKFKNDLASTYSEIGKKHLANEAFDEAKKYFELAVGESSDDFEELDAIKNNLRKSEDGIRNKSAEKLFNQGLELFASGDFDGAQERFSRAYDLCTDDYKDRKSIENNISKAVAAIFNRDGSILYNEEKYEAAAELFKEAVKNLPEVYADDLKAFKNNLANAYNKVGLASWLGENFLKSKENFTLAYQTCSIDRDEREIFNEQMQHATAAVYNEEGDALTASLNFAEAIEKYKKALLSVPCVGLCDLNVFNTTDSEQEYRKNLARAYNQHGLQLLEALDYDKAKMSFILAVDEAREGGDVEAVSSYEANLEIVKSAILNKDIAELSRKGSEMLQAESFEGALKLFTKAVNICSANYHKRQHLIDNMNFSRAAIHHRDGLRHFYDQQFTTAIDEIAKALEILPKERKVEGKMYEESLAEAYNAHGEVLMSQKCFQLALTNYRKTASLSKIEGRAEIYENNRKIAQYEVFIEAGMNYVKFNKLDQAAVTFRDAVNILESLGETSHNLHTANPTNALETYAETLLAENKISAGVDTFELALQFASDDQKGSILAKRNAARLEYLSTKGDALFNAKKFEEALALIDEALTISPSDDFTSQINSTKSLILNEFTEILISDKNFDKAIDTIEQTRNLSIETGEIVNEKIAAVNLCRTIENIRKLEPEPAIRRLLKALRSFTNFECLDHDTKIIILDIFLQHQAIEQAEEFVERNPEELRKIYNERVNGNRYVERRADRMITVRTKRANERILI